MEAKILVVDDDPALLDIVRTNLELEGYTVMVASNGKEALARAREERPEVLVLDVMMPELSGFEVLRTIRQAPSEYPDSAILLLTARDTLGDKGEGFGSGADDYLTKPFDPQELIWRVQALLKRGRAPEAEPTQGRPEPARSPSYRVGPLVLFPSTLEVEVRNARIRLTPLEFGLLQTLAEQPGEVFPPEILLKKVWQYEADDDVFVVRVHINHLRQKIEETPGSPTLIQTVRNRGYVLNA